MSRQLFGANGQPAGVSSGGGNANVYITVPVVDVNPILLIGRNAVVKVSASVYDESNRIVKFDLRLNGLQIMLEAVKNGKMWEAEHTFAVVGQSGERLEIFCNAIDATGLRSFAGTPQIPPRLTQSRIAAPGITSPTQDEYKTAGSIVIKGTEFVSLGASDTHKAVHGRVVLADDPQIVRWEGSLAGALTQITAAWTPAGDGQEDLLCSLAYEGYSGGMGEWSEPVRVRLVKSGVSVPVIVWPLNGEKYADPNLLRVNAEQPTIKSGSWTGTEWQVSEYADFSNLVVCASITDADVPAKRIMTDLLLGGLLGRRLYLRCRHLTSIGPTEWSETVTLNTAAHQTLWEFTSSGTFNPPISGVYEILCVGQGGSGGKTGYGGGGGGSSGYVAVGSLFIDKSISYSIGSSVTNFASIVANKGGDGAHGSTESGAFSGANGGAGGVGGGGGGAYNQNGSVGLGGAGVDGDDGANGVKSTGPGIGGKGGGIGGGEGGIPSTGHDYGLGGYGYGAGSGGQGDGDSGGGGGAQGYGGETMAPFIKYYSK